MNPSGGVNGAGRDPGAFADRRASIRTAAYHARYLRLEPSRRSVFRYGVGYTGTGNGFAGPLGAGAELIDVSDTGCGLRVFTPLVIGSNVSIVVELHSKLSCVELRVGARVVHCCSHEDELYRVGLSFQDIQRWPLHCGHEGAYVPTMDW